MTLDADPERHPIGRATERAARFFRVGEAPSIPPRRATGVAT